MTEQVAYTTVNIVVARNEFEPRFASSEFRRDQLSEKVEVGTSIITVRAEDRDGVSAPLLNFEITAKQSHNLSQLNCVFPCHLQDPLLYSLVPKEPETGFFFLNPTTGVITLAKTFTTTPDEAERQTEYRVCSRVCSKNRIGGYIPMK